TQIKTSLQHLVNRIEQLLRGLLFHQIPPGTGGQRLRCINRLIGLRENQHRCADTQFPKRHQQIERFPVFQPQVSQNEVRLLLGDQEGSSQSAVAFPATAQIRLGTQQTDQAFPHKEIIFDDKYPETGDPSAERRQDRLSQQST